MIGVMLGVLLVLLLGAVHAGGVGTYMMVMDERGSTLVVMDTRTSQICVLEGGRIRDGRPFDKSDRLIRGYQSNKPDED